MEITSEDCATIAVNHVKMLVNQYRNFNFLIFEDLKDYPNAYKQK